MGFLKKHRKIIAYFFAGGISTLVNIVTFTLLTFISKNPVYEVFANVIAVSLSIIVAFILNKIFVFKSKSFRPIVLLSEASSFIIARAGTGLFDIAFIYFTVTLPSVEDPWLIMSMKLLSNVIVTILNYFLSEFIVFRKKRVSHFGKILFAEGIEYYACIPLSSCKVTKKYLLDKNGLESDSTVIMMLFPYRTKQRAENLSAYASVKDYHLYVDELSQKLEKFIKKKHPSAKFKVFADHSPIDEVHAACVSGLGFIGDNGLLINERYSSFVFLGECITSLTPKELGLTFTKEDEFRTCLHCGKCKEACPTGCIATDENGADKSIKSECLSAITQKKGALTDEEKSLILENGSIWGCDVCQNVCPYTKNAKYTPIKFFNDGVIARLDAEMLENMSDEEFKARPFAWRGREVIKRNVSMWEEANPKVDKPKDTEDATTNGAELDEQGK
ncbi:MAG: DUF1730 domain-containing protein [Clostridia bacterium]|nr:DUF1730 domain-containing protein [Clostridia bacterium]